MLHAVSVWMVAAGFFGAGLVNATGTPATRSGFVRWGYPAWWGRVTGALEMASAVLIAVPGSREAGLVLGAAIIAVAAMTVLRHRELSHLAPLGLFAGLLATAGLTA